MYSSVNSSISLCNIYSLLNSFLLHLLVSKPWHLHLSPELPSKCLSGLPTSARASLPVLFFTLADNDLQTWISDHISPLKSFQWLPFTCRTKLKPLLRSTLTTSPITLKLSFIQSISIQFQFQSYKIPSAPQTHLVYYYNFQFVNSWWIFIDIFFIINSKAEKYINMLNGLIVESLRHW